MADQLRASIARVFTADGGIAGAGFLASREHLVTCAHVVADALLLPRDTPDPPAADVSFDLPLVAPGQKLTAKVICWRPVRPAGAPAGDGVEDVAVLKLAEARPVDASLARLVAGGDLWGHPFRAFGFPAGYDDGVWASGVLRDEQASGWVQIEDLKATGYFVEPGFSGTAVWDEQAEAIVGMVVAAEQRPEVKAAFVIPTARLAQAWPDLTQQALPPCPYRGLEPFGPAHATFFFGREKLTDQLVTAVERPLTVVMGSSGSGKSSLVFAGLVPCLRQQGTWLDASFRPSEGLYNRLAGVLAPLLEPQMSAYDQLQEAAKMASGFEQAEADKHVALQDVVQAILRQNPTARRLLLVVDQFEELYTYYPDPAEQHRFLDLLLAAVRAQPEPAQLSLVLTMRSDFYPQAFEYGPFEELLRGALFPVRAMERSELRDAIVKPAEKLGVRIEDGLTERILDAVTQGPGDLPLLEFALSLLWEKQSNGELTHQAYDEIGGVEQALAKHAEQVFSTLKEADQREVQRVFLQLVRPLDDKRDVRRLACRADLSDQDWRLITRLARDRLVVTGRDEATGQETVEAAHEALIREWSRLHGWIEADRGFRTWQEQLRGDIRQWEARGRDDGSLLRGKSLQEADDWLKKRQPDFSPTERAYVEASLALRARDEAERARRARQERLVRRVAVAAAVVFLGLSLFAVEQRSVAEQQREAALAGRLAAQALTHLDDHFDLALLLSLEADRIAQHAAGRWSLQGLAGGLPADRGVLASAGPGRGSLQNAFIANPGLSTYLRARAGPVASVAISRDGQTLASAGCAELANNGRCSRGEVLLWARDGASYRPAGALAADGLAAVSTVAFSPDDRFLAAGGCQGSGGGCGRGRVFVWRGERHEPLGLLDTPDMGQVTSLAFGWERQILAAGACAAGPGDACRAQVLLWDADQAQPLRTIDLQTDRVQGVAFSPRDDLLAAGSVDGTVRVARVATGQPYDGVERRHDGEVRSVAFSPDGRTLASGALDRAIWLWSLDAPESSVRLDNEAGRVESLAFAPDGKTLAAGTRENTIALWDVDGRQPLGQPLTGHSDRVLSLAFSPDGALLASGSQDESIILWDLVRQRRSGQPIRALPAGGVASLAFSPRGEVLAWGGCGQADSSGDCTRGEIRVWDVASDRLPTVLAAHADQVQALAFSRDGRRLASGGGAGDKAVKLWDLDGRAPAAVDLGSHRNAVKSLAFNPLDPAQLVSGARDSTALLWTIGGPAGQSLPFAAPSPVFSVAFRPDGARLALGTRDDGILVWDARQRTVIQRLSDPGSADPRARPKPVENVAYSPDGRLLASSQGTWITLWDAESGRQVDRLTGHLSDIQTLAFSPDGAMLASGSADRTVILWDARIGEQLGLPLRGHADTVTKVAFSPDGRMLASGGADGNLLLWNLDFAPERVCQVVARNLTADEWHQYLGSRPYEKTCPELP